MTRSCMVGLATVAAVVGITACSDDGSSHSKAAGNLGRIRSDGEITVVTRNAPTAYYLDRHAQPAGPEQTMIAAFAKHLGVKVTFRVEDSIAAVLQTLRRGYADVAAAGLTATAARRDHFSFGPSYQKVRQQVVCNRKDSKPGNVAELAGVDLEVIADSSYDERLHALKKTHPDLHWRTNAKLGTEQLMARVWQHEIHCTVADSNIVAINRRYYPSLRIMFDLALPEPLAWAMPKNAEALAGAVKTWFQDYRANGGLAAMKSRYYGYIPEFDYVENQTLVERIEQLYPKYDHLFEQAGERNGIPPLLLAAQAYQESHWDPKAKSPSGVRGMMMLTRRTASAVGVDDRLDPAESISGGAHYLAQMKDAIDADIPARDRVFLALAAYNIGLTHVRDAQKLASRLGKDAKSWADMKSVFPLLADKRYYPSLKYGYARGTAPVRYISRIRDYEDVIRRQVD